MAKPRTYNSEDFSRPLRRVLVGFSVVLFLALFVLWRIDSPRVERFRMAAFTNKTSNCVKNCSR